MPESSALPAIMQYVWAISAVVTILGMVFAFFFITWPFMKRSEKMMARMLELAEQQAIGSEPVMGSKEEAVKASVGTSRAQLSCIACNTNLGTVACEPEKSGQVFRVLCGPCQAGRDA
jgi:hypothetical protein